MNNDKLFLQCPVRNESIVGAQVYSHSGEYSPLVDDFRLPARGVSVQLLRKYRAANCYSVSPMGRGWTFPYLKKLEYESDDILYHDGWGRIHRFKSLPLKDSFSSPDSLYMRLEAAEDTFFLRQRHGQLLSFERPEKGGRLLSIEDSNGNTLRFKYRKKAIQILDPLERTIDIRLDQNRIVSLSYADRVWHYIYNDEECLIEVIQPPTQEVPDGSRTQYAYDESFRLTSITNPNGQVYLRNSYDDYGRISRQKHGNGFFKFEYETIGETDLGFPIYRTQVRLKNNARLELKHDASGHAVERTLWVSAASLSSDDRVESNDETVPLTTKTVYNRHGEIAQRTSPTGDAIYLSYDEESLDPLNRGNLLEMKRTPAPGSDTDQMELITQYSYEPNYQHVKLIIDARGNTTRFEHDDRGNLTEKLYPAVTILKANKKTKEKRATQQANLSETFEYNEAGQLTRFTDARGAKTEYFYHPVAAPGGTGNNENPDSYTQSAGGYLARIVRDADGKERPLKSNPVNFTNDYRYDAFGNRTAIVDGKGNPTRFEYDEQNRVVKVISRKPFDYQRTFQYDANGNLLEAIASFDHNEYDPITKTIISKAATASQRFEYNLLNNPLSRTDTGGGREITHTWIRDADENIVRSIQPMGNIIEYEYDERRLLIAQRHGVKAKDEAETRHAYTRAGRRRSSIDAIGNTVRYDYDGFNRYKGFANAAGTVKKQRLDEMGNVTQLLVIGDCMAMNEREDLVANEASVLLESSFQHDELNRLVQINNAWTDPLTGESLGKSQWNGEEGKVSTIIEYDGNNLPTKVWQETGNILNIQYDGANRPVLVRDGTGESISMEYDENSNPIHMERLGPIIEGDENRSRQIFKQEFDELDRLVSRSTNGGSPETTAYNALGHITEYKNEAGVSANYLHDGFGRPSGLAITATVPGSVTGRQTEQLILQRNEWNDNNRLSALINAANHSTKYAYDELNRLISIVYADGTSRHFEHDANGNIVRLMDPNGNIITNRFDAQDRLIERSIESGTGRHPQIEKFHYDGLNRLVAAVTDSATTLFRYDSLSRLLEESQSGRVIKYGYDSAGNPVRLTYPSGQEIRSSYDSLRRLTEVRNGQSQLLGSYRYGSGTQILEQNLGDVLKAAFTYEPDRDWLNSIIYRSIKTGEVIKGSECRYDVVGNRIEERQLRHDTNSGERYIYDSANRLVKAQYGVKDLADPDSPFVEEVLYELSPTGIWQLKTTRNANAQLLEQVIGEVNQQEAYLSLGSLHFEYDANGNRIVEANGDDKESVKKRFRYDYANRVVGVESVAEDGREIQTIEYAYDAFNRQILKLIKKDGVTQEFVRVWKGSQLIEEWQDGKLAKWFTYGARINEPLKMTLSSEDEDKDYLFLLNSRGSIAGLTDPHGKLEEAYSYDVIGQPFLTIQNGQEVNQSTLLSSINTSILGNSNIYDVDIDLYISFPSFYYDSRVGQAVNKPFGTDQGGSFGSGNPFNGGSFFKPGEVGYHGLDLSALGHGLGGKSVDDYFNDLMEGLLGSGFGHKGYIREGLKALKASLKPGSNKYDSGDEYSEWAEELMGGKKAQIRAGIVALKASLTPGSDKYSGYGEAHGPGGLYGPGGFMGPGMPGYRGLDLSNLGGNGGVGGFGASLGPGGAWIPNDEGSKVADLGKTAMSIGAGAMVGGILSAPTTGGLGLGVAIVGAIAFGFGAASYYLGSKAETQADKDKPSPAEPAKEPTPAPAPPKPASEQPKPEKPKPKGSLPPDPDGGGGGVDPTMLPDYDGSGGGNPLWMGRGLMYLPDFDGSGGGDPTTIWDENGGGGTPNT